MLPQQQQRPPQAQEQEMPPEGAAPNAEQGAQMQAPDIDPEEMQMALFMRIETLSPQEAQVFAQAITPQNVPVFFKVFPELGPLFDHILQAKGGGAGMQQPPQGGAPQPQEQPTGPARNPLLDDGLSRGLMG